MAYVATVKKDKLKTYIRTSKEKIEGFIYKLPQSRLLDMMNQKSEPFIAVSEATVCSAVDGKLLYRTDFIAVNKNHVIHISGEIVEEAVKLEKLPEGEEWDHTFDEFNQS